MHRRSFIQSSLAAAATAAMPLPLLAAGTRTRIDSDIAAITLDGGEVTLPKAVVKELVAAMRGSMLLPGSTSKAMFTTGRSFAQLSRVIVEATLTLTSACAMLLRSSATSSTIGTHRVKNGSVSLSWTYKTSGN